MKTLSFYFISFLVSLVFFISFLFLVISYGVVDGSDHQMTSYKRLKRHWTIPTLQNKKEPTRVCAVPRNAYILALRNVCRLENLPYFFFSTQHQVQVLPTLFLQFLMSSGRITVSVDHDLELWWRWRSTQDLQATMLNCLRDSLMLLGRWLKKSMHKIKQLLDATVSRAIMALDWL